jgi:hypothetical protein
MSRTKSILLFDARGRSWAHPRAVSNAPHTNPILSIGLYYIPAKWRGLLREPKVTGANGLAGQGFSRHQCRKRIALPPPTGAAAQT